MKPQKFFRGHKVHVNRGRYFNFHAIVQGSYSDLHGAPNLGYGPEYRERAESYQIVELKDGEPINSWAWIDECELVLVDADRDKGEAILQAYKSR